MELVNNFACVYFTPLPYIIYDQSVKMGNLPYKNIGALLIRNQQIFWVSCSIMSFVVYNRNNFDLIYLNIFLFHFSLGLYILSFVKTFNILRFLYQ